MKIIDRFRNIFGKMLTDRKMPLEERVMFFVFFTMIVSTIVVIFQNAFTGYLISKNIKWVIFISFIVVTAILYWKLESKRRIIRNISFVMLIYVLFPVLYIMSGGLRTASIPYMIVLLLAVSYAFNGKPRIFFIASYIVISQILMVLNFTTPEIFPVISDKTMFIDWITNTPIILTMIAMLTLWVSGEYRYEREKAARFSKEIDELSKNDALTGIYNRRYLKQRVQELLEEGDKVCIFIFDIDRFKAINDSRGHIEGDKLLISVASNMVEVFPEMTSIRFGGDEFLLIGSGCGEKNIREMINEFRHGLLDQLNITISGGVSAYTESLEETLRKADRLLYQAKNDGRNKVIIDI